MSYLAFLRFTRFLTYSNPASEVLEVITDPNGVEKNPKLVCGVVSDPVRQADISRYLKKI